MGRQGGNLGTVSQIVSIPASYPSQQPGLILNITGRDHGDANIYIDTYPHGYFNELTTGHVTRTSTPTATPTNGPTTTSTRDTHCYGDEYVDTTGDQHSDPDTHTGSVVLWDDFDPGRETWTHTAALGTDDWHWRLPPMLIAPAMLTTPAIRMP